MTKPRSPHGKRNNGLYNTCEYLHIKDWRELIELLKTL